MPAGTVVASSSIYIHRQEELFPQARRFMPERWLDEEGNFSTALDKYMVQFSKGARQCIGQGLATAEILVTLAHVFRKCDVQPTRDTPKELVL